MYTILLYTTLQYKTRTHKILLIIVTVESDTVKCYEFFAAYCYECAARVTMLKAMNIVGRFENNISIYFYNIMYMYLLDTI